MILTIKKIIVGILKVLISKGKNELEKIQIIIKHKKHIITKKARDEGRFENKNKNGKLKENLKSFITKHFRTRFEKFMAIKQISIDQISLVCLGSKPNS